MDKKELAKFIGNKIRYYRTKLNLTQDQLGEKLNTKKATISNYETGYRTPKQDDLFEIAHILNISIDDLFPARNSKKNDITSIYNKLTPPRQENVLNYANEQLEEQNSKGDNVVDINSYKQEKTPVNVNGCVSAGVGERLHDETLFTEMVKAPIPAHDLALKVNGDSMEPMFKDGEIIFVEKTHNIKNGQIGIFIIEEEAYVKKVFVEDDRLTLVSLNKEYDDLHFYRNESVRLIGKVIL
ncbi:TPA: helix-turn-helix domain-containing protein [Staphylococcus aureus]|uniref:helix-turn-helix domain-containing protein n=1 Tax=Staphylococcus aureus TaxID=1280 RepID=UPI002022D6E2|nr:XRE family transcriptional regulator [Staphylococcus aureus]URH52543.1 XRE family transcriptional regulator [Staphylococcus aureus]HDA2515623.1 helix-turn-helix transcriptional regulator [Staphylococcus aureus]HDJ1601784.1 helix-turn-helix transcriptional regulator [Staphylococcus aureus]HDJ2664031.1 helix-turn-helix transcriptional regulator [Staphylococcus aureus]HEI4303616.1 helix-turn-helix transcriptional regulator [Staphylococcus aureus]